MRKGDFSQEQEQEDQSDREGITQNLRGSPLPKIIVAKVVSAPNPPLHNDCETDQASSDQAEEHQRTEKERVDYQEDHAEYYQRSRHHQEDALHRTQSSSYPPKNFAETTIGVLGLRVNLPESVDVIEESTTLLLSRLLVTQALDLPLVGAELFKKSDQYNNDPSQFYVYPSVTGTGGKREVLRRL